MKNKLPRAGVTLALSESEIAVALEVLDDIEEGRRDESSAALDRVSASTGRTQGAFRATAILTGASAGSPISLDDKKKATGVGLGIRDYGF